MLIKYSWNVRLQIKYQLLKFVLELEGQHPCEKHLNANEPIIYLFFIFKSPFLILHF